MSIYDITGKKFGRLLVLSRALSSPSRKAMWNCLCDCGRECVVDGWALRSGHTTSCGCFQKERVSNANSTHGKSKSRLYYVWNEMRQRCENTKHVSYSLYGGRGISVCEDWKNFDNFYHWAIDNGYDAKAQRGNCTIDRLDSNGDYCPSNCTWASSKEQARNRRNTLKVIYNGELRVLSELCEILSVEYPLVYARVVKLGWSVERALSTPKLGSR